jgi:uncharacterized membrane protein
MATTAERPRAKAPRPPAAKRPPVKQAGTQTGKKTAKPVEKVAAKTGKQVALKAGKAVMTKSPSPTAKLARAATDKGVKVVVGRTLAAGADMLRTGAERTAGASLDAVDKVLARRPPLQRSLDVAVPIHVAWREWVELDRLPEGFHQVENIKRRRDGRLRGRVAQTGARWEAEVLDQRPNESFAWQSVKGSDCAGLITFHRLSERLTRLELNLDVIPQGMPEAMGLLTYLADRRAEADLRRFKAHVELINPDLYDDEPQDDDEGDPPDSQSEG